MKYRKMTSADVLTIFEIAILGKEKSFTREALYAVGITEEMVADTLDGARTHEGWICECDDKVVGFSMANRGTGELWVMAVLPEYEKRGIGSKLHDTAIDFIKAQDFKEAWLGVLQDIQVNAYGFFTKRGWKDDEMRGPFRIMKKSLVAG